MSAFNSLFEDSTKLDDANFKYDAKKASAPKTSSFPYQGLVQLFKFDTIKDQNQPLGNVTFLIKPQNSRSYLFLYQQSSKPILQIQLSPEIKWISQGLYSYITDSSGNRWSLQFPDKMSAIRASIALGSSAVGADGSKLQTFDVRTGDGEMVAEGDTIRVSYTGILGNELPLLGKQFDSNDNYTFTVGSDKIIRGWSQGSIGMKAGGVRIFVIPPDLAYGSTSIPNKIPANSWLLY